MFLDEVTITVLGGNGGNGCVSWRREKYVPKGGPAGGDGGNGGRVLLRADPNTDTLSSFLSKKRFSAENGEAGMGACAHGKRGEDLILLVPPGTLVYEESEGEMTLLKDLQQPGEEVIVAKGGKGGFGNAHFTSSTRQRPDFAELGEPGEEKHIHLQLKLVADVGIIGYPNAGKSTLISCISSAKPKIASYPFTTLVPNLGVVHVGDRSFIACDIPGLIEGASAGKGLGDLFLKHIERCSILLHVLDASHALKDGGVESQELLKDYRLLRTELERYSELLAQKREYVVLNKVDLLSPDDIQLLEDALKKEGLPFLRSISAATQKGVETLAKELMPIVLKEREKRENLEKEKEPDIPLLRPHQESRRMDAYEINKTPEGIFITGERIEQFARMTNIESKGALQRFRDVLKRTHLLQQIKTLRKDSSLPVYIGNIRIDDYI